VAEHFTVETVHLDVPALVGALSRRLHVAGLPMTPARAAGLARALTLVRPISRRRLYWTCRAVVVADPTQVRAFDAVFGAVFGAHDLDAEIDEIDVDTTLPEPEGDRAPGEGSREGMDSVATAPPAADEEDGTETEVPLTRASEEERLAGRSFDRLEAHELAQLYRLMSRLRLVTPPRRRRRHDRARHGARVDLRRTLRASLRTAGDPIRLARRERRVEPRRLVLLCDISGSMEPYARAYLQFLTCAATAGPNAEAFVFATRLTRVTRALAARQPDLAMARAARAASDWSSGTRIGDALKAFNDRHGRRGMARGAVVVILSDGWERGEPDAVGREMARLARLAHRIVWVNPRVAATAFSVQAGGMVAALPFCDALVSGHSYEALREVVEAIGAAGRSVAPLPAPPAPAEDEPWASATPIQGSSVAMPSGYGPSRGRTTPGWNQ
jgi:uncharacterized protein with von Willebrand factor type A (vWA) domain